MGCAMRVLLVEDDNRFADALMVALRRHGLGVHRAVTAAEALAAPGADLVLLDLGLPDMDGIEVCRRLRGAGDTAIIAVTARGTSGTGCSGCARAPTTTWSSRSGSPS